jgi:hypothetical protein
MTEMRTVAIIDPRTMVAFAPHEVTDELLVEILLELKRRESAMTEWRRTTEDEIVRRGLRAAGAYRVDIGEARSRVWDGQQLHQTLARLLEDRIITIRDATGVVERTYKVDGRKAVHLLDTLDGEALQMVRDCFTWKAGRTRVQVTPAQLEQ